MSTLTISLRDSVRLRLENLAQEYGVPLDDFIASTLSQRAAVADAESYIQRRGAEWRAKFKRWPKAKQRAHLIAIGALTAEGEIPVYPMDHVPLGPRH